MAHADQFPSGSVNVTGEDAAGSEKPCAWTLYFHDPEDSSWTPESYKVIGSFTSFPDLWATFNKIGEARILSGMFFIMRDPYPPLWEHRANIRGGSYSVKIPEKTAHETFLRYAAAAILGIVSKDTTNKIVGVSISPKKGFHILKVWNVEAKSFHKPGDVNIYGDGMLVADIIYKPHIDQKM